jgi:hypothetical protein
MGIPVGHGQEKMWVGAGDVTGLDSPAEPFLRTLAARVHYTADRMGAPVNVILEKFVKGEIPLLSLTAAGAIGAGALQDRTSRETPAGAQ